MLFSLSFFALSLSSLVSAGCTPAKSPTPGPVAAVTFDAFDVDLAQQYRYQKQMGANAGSMFVHEQWMDNSPYTCASGHKSAELDIASGWGGVKGAQSELEHHWDTFLTEDYFENIASMGVNTVRLPIGYWSLGGNWTTGTPFEPYAAAYANSWGRVLRTVKWCEKYKLGVLIDLHGAPGSQNGQAHSGTSGGKIGLWGNQKYIKRTQDILVWLAEQFQYVNNVVGLELLNEPKYGTDLLNFYEDTIPLIRAVAKTLPIYLHDGFNLGGMTDWVTSNTQKWQPVIIDHHHYYVFQGKFKQMPITQITSQVIPSDTKTLSSASSKLKGNLIVGEMGCANADGQSVSNMDSAVSANCQAQMKMYHESTAGPIFWSMKTAGCKPSEGNGWCFIGSVGKYLPKTFVVPSGRISSGGVTITPGTGPSNGGSSAPVSTTPAPSTCVAKTAKTKRSLSEKHHRRALRIKRQSVNDSGYTEGHIAAHSFALQGRALGMPHAFIQARAVHLGIEEEHFEHFKRGFEEGHDSGLDAVEARRRR